MDIERETVRPKSEISIQDFPDADASFLGLYIPESCKCCGRHVKDHMYVVKVNDMRMVFCMGCLETLRDEINRTVNRSVKPGDTIWIIGFKPSAGYESIPMTVKSVYPEGDKHEFPHGKVPYNIYAKKDDGSQTTYLTFNSRNKAWFVTKEAADAAVEEINKKKAK